MDDVVLTPLTGLDKAETYQEITRDILAVLDGESNRVAKMATCVSLLSGAFDSWFWTGFYMVDEVKRSAGIDELVVGPYNGTLGCLRIAFGRGVCGAAAATRTTQIIADVHAFPGHIACDPQSRSEIVIPLIQAGELIGVLDLDSPLPGRFDADDASGLAETVSILLRHSDLSVL